MQKPSLHVVQAYGLKFYPKQCSWIIQAFSDSDFAGDREMRRSVYGYFIYFCGIPIAWKSKGMRSVVLSTTEAEYIALSEVVKEIKFIIQLMSTINMNVEVPITIYVDNVGAIWLSNNRTTSERTKHVHIRTAFVKKRKDVVKFMKFEENDADINTKNTPNTTFKTHQAKIVWEKDEITRKDSQTQVSIDRKDVNNMLWHIAHDTHFVRCISNCTI